MPSKEALRLAKQTGCLLSEAEAVLEGEPDHSVALAKLNAVLCGRRRIYSARLENAWGQFAGTVDAPDLDVDQTIAFIQALELCLEDPLVLTIAYELQAPTVGVFLKQPWIDGWARLEAVTIEEMKRCLGHLREDFDSESCDYFRHVYRFTYNFTLSDGAKMLNINTATAYWNLLLKPRYPEIIGKWIDFVTHAKIDTVSRDTWTMILEFCEYATRTDPSLAEYDEAGAWPGVIDDFVDSLKESGWKQETQ